MNYRDYIRDYDMKMRQADRIVRERAGDTLNIFDFIPPAENLEEACLIVRALRERYDGYIFILEDEKRWEFPFNIRVARAVGVR